LAPIISAFDVGVCNAAKPKASDVAALRRTKERRFIED